MAGRPLSQCGGAGLPILGGIGKFIPMQPDQSQYQLVLVFWPYVGDELKEKI